MAYLTEGEQIGCQVKVTREISQVKAEIGGLRIKNIQHVHTDGSLQYSKNFYYDNSDNAALSSGTLADSISVTSMLNGTACGTNPLLAMIYRSTPTNSVSLTPIHDFNVEERVLDQRHLHYFTSYADGYTDDYGTVMFSPG